MKRPIAVIVLSLFAVLLLAGCQGSHNHKDTKPVSSAVGLGPVRVS